MAAEAKKLEEEISIIRDIAEWRRVHNKNNHASAVRLLKKLMAQVRRGKR